MAFKKAKNRRIRSRPPWLPELEHELAMFPMGKYDDQVDSMSQALAHIFTSSADAQGFVDHLKRMAHAASGVDLAETEPRSVRVTTEQLNCIFHLCSGRDVSPDKDGVFWVTERGAQGLHYMPGIKIHRG